MLDYSILSLKERTINAIISEVVQNKFDINVL